MAHVRAGNHEDGMHTTETLMNGTYSAPNSKNALPVRDGVTANMDTFSAADALQQKQLLIMLNEH